MLLFIGLILIYFDIYVGSVDVIPDIAGYIVLVIGFFTVRERLKLSSRLLVPICVALVCNLLLLLYDWSLSYEVGLYALEAIGQYIFMFLLLRSALSEAGEAASSDVWTLRISAAKTGLILILLAALFGIPLTAVMPLAGSILRILFMLCGLYVTAVVFALYRKTEA